MPDEAPASVAFRRARTDETNEIRELIIRSMGHWKHPPAYLEAARQLMDLSPADLARDEAWMVLADEAVAGFYRLSRADASAAEIEEFHLEPPMIGRGIGRLMFAHACDRARAMGARRLVWSTDVHSLGFYRRMGGEVTGTEASGIDGDAPLTTMQLELHGEGSRQPHPPGIIVKSSRARSRNATTNETELLVAMTGKASPAKAADGDEPVFAYIASLPQPQRDIAERIDALAAKELPNLQRGVKWGMAYYGVDGGWCFASGAFVGHVKLMFIRGTELDPEPPVTPVGMGKATRGVELAQVDDLDERLVASWMKQAAATPFFGGKKR